MFCLWHILPNGLLPKSLIITWLTNNVSIRSNPEPFKATTIYHDVKMSSLFYQRFFMVCVSFGNWQFSSATRSPPVSSIIAQGNTWQRRPLIVGLLSINPTMPRPLFLGATMPVLFSRVIILWMVKGEYFWDRRNSFAIWIYSND